VTDHADKLDDRAKGALEGRLRVACALPSLTPAAGLDGLWTKSSGASAGETLTRALLGKSDALDKGIAASDEQSFGFDGNQASGCPRHSTELTSGPNHHALSKS